MSQQPVSLGLLAVGATALGAANVQEVSIALSFSVCYERSETAAGFSAEDLKRAEAQWREQGSPKGLTSD